jgi:hypothetical protein
VRSRLSRAQQHSDIAAKVLALRTGDCRVVAFVTFATMWSNGSTLGV